MSRILITGTSKGIGYNAACFLAKRGHHVIATMRNPGKSDLADLARQESLAIEVHAMDVDSESSVNAVFDQVGEVDVLINNAGILSYDTIEDESQATIEAVMNTNFFGVVRCSKAIVPQMRERGSGCIINIGSVAGTIAVSPSAAYASSKFALEAFSEVLAQEMLPFDVQVYLIQPGIIDTPMATSEFPTPKADSVYANGRRISALFELAKHMDAPPELVSEKLLYLIESRDERLRHPVGPDALQFLGYRATVDDERFISTWGAPTDEEFLTKTRSDMMLDLGPFMPPK